MPDKVFNVGVIGYGLSAKIFHIPFIKLCSHFRLHSIVQRTPKPGNSAPIDHPDLKHYNDTQKLITDPEVDVVVITSPPNTHYDLSKASLLASKHILVEKPFVPSYEEAEDLAAIAAERGVLICIYQNRRWDLDFLTARELISNRSLGRVFEYNSHFDLYIPKVATTNWKAELGIPQAGSILYDLGTHLIDQAYSIFGLPQSVHGRLMNQREGKPDLFMPDYIVMELAYEGGLLVNIRSNTLSVESTQPRFWIRGTSGSFYKQGLDPQEHQLLAGVQVTDVQFGREDLDRYRLTIVADDGTILDEKVSELSPQTYLAFYEAWGRAVASEKPEDVPVKASESMDVLRIIEAVIESARTGEDVIL